MPNLKTQTFRPRRVVLTIGVLLIPIGLATGPLNHHLMVWLNHGTWCAQFKPDGTTLIKYGAKACGM